MAEFCGQPGVGPSTPTPPRDFLYFQHKNLDLIINPPKSGSQSPGGGGPDPEKTSATTPKHFKKKSENFLPVSDLVGLRFWPPWAAAKQGVNSFC